MACTGTNGTSNGAAAPAAAPTATDSAPSDTTACCPPICPTEPPLPPDIPWRLAGSQALATNASVTSTGTAVQDVTLEKLGGGLYPSISVFYYLVPLTETITQFPNNRIVMIKVFATLTGMKAVPGSDVSGLFYNTVPCVGAIIDVFLSYFDDKSGAYVSDGVYVKDVYPKHQETTFNELVGEETLDKVSSSVSTTKQWNASATGGAQVGPVSLGGSASESETQTTARQREHSERHSRQTEVHHIQHVLTAYHVGGSEVAFTIQPRPFEGETWQLVQGYRLVEGIQEFVIVAAFPADAAYWRINANMRVGFKAHLIREHPFPKYLGDPTVKEDDSQIEQWSDVSHPWDFDGDKLRMWRALNEWESYADALKKHREIIKALGDYWALDFLLSAPIYSQFSELDLYDTAADLQACQGAPNPCDLVAAKLGGDTGAIPVSVGGAITGGTISEGTLHATLHAPVFPAGAETGTGASAADLTTGTTPGMTLVPAMYHEIMLDPNALPLVGTLATSTERRHAANAQMQQMFDALAASAALDPNEAVPLTETRFYRGTAFQALAQSLRLLGNGGTPESSPTLAGAGPRRGVPPEILGVPEPDWSSLQSRFGTVFVDALRARVQPSSSKTLGQDGGDKALRDATATTSTGRLPGGTGGATRG
jgi:hypothetical protein